MPIIYYMSFCDGGEGDQNGVIMWKKDVRKGDSNPTGLHLGPEPSGVYQFHHFRKEQTAKYIIFSLFIKEESFSGTGELKDQLRYV